MNLHALTVHMMLGITGQWLDDPEFRQALEAAGPLGVGLLWQLEQGHAPLALLESKRAAAVAALRALINEAGALDDLHDRKARSLYRHLQAFIEGCDDPEEIDEYRKLMRLLFPIGLRVIRLPFIEESGAAVALEKTVTPEIRAKLAAISVGKHTLDDLLTQWLDAGRRLGKVMKARAELKASLRRKGSAAADVDLQAGRKGWIAAVEGLLWGFTVNEKVRVLEEPVVATLDEAIAIALRRRGSGSGGSVEASEGVQAQGEELGDGEVLDEGEALDEELDDEALDEGEELDEGEALDQGEALDEEPQPEDDELVAEAPDEAPG